MIYDSKQKENLKVMSRTSINKIADDFNFLKSYFSII